MPNVTIIPVSGIPEIEAGDDIASAISSALARLDLSLHDGDVVVIAQKIVSKAEGRVVALDSVEPSARAVQWAAQYDKDARVVEVVLRESKRIVRMERGIIVSETTHGFICANAGVDTSNVASDVVALLPEDPDLSAEKIRDALQRKFRTRIAVIISDTFGRPWREGLVNVAIGVAGMPPLIDYRGQKDSAGRPLRVTVIASADELASAAELVMKKNDAIPVAIVRGLTFEARSGSARELLREPGLDLFR
ncbi:MAG TPA: coenzyme F420-0:L-glutamate ligase [Blastocatellia bacterium]|nr:coenzyme F420-0:L-glutamate ligase [Blastocatellia bacterium]